MQKRIKTLLFIFIFVLIFSKISGNEPNTNAQQDYLKDIQYINKIKFQDLVLPLCLQHNFVKEGTSVEDASNILIKLFPPLKKISQKSYLHYDDIALICMQIYNLEGGFFYSITQSKHYSFRELQYKNLISQDIDPMKKISGKAVYELFSQLSQQ